ncbi:hypothetical protein LTR53_002760 [Teratosphaeriaceae sp. CCFEE 6253]|nr:hypothetical protein LTR53_002760 [Teratosphaeriaceae sp. CCFEE 6253]
MSKPIAFIIGAGKNIGASTATAFLNKGYRVALVARTVKPEESKDDTLQLVCDLTKPETVSSVFASLRQSWGEPSVVVYNAAAAHFPPKDDPFSIKLEDFTSDVAVNMTSTYVALQEAIVSFRGLPATEARAFLYTGNVLNQTPMLNLVTCGVGKTATAQMIETATMAFGESGMKYVDGPAHADFFVELAEGKSKVPWLATFVKGQGYTSFPKL